MSKVLKIAEELRQELLLQRLKAGESAPSIRQVSERYSVSLMTASRILEHLVQCDFLYRIPNHGTYVKHDPPLCPRIGYVGDVSARGHSKDVLRVCAFERLQAFWDTEGIVPRYVSDVEFRASKSCLDGLDGIVIMSSHIDDNTLPLLWNFPGRIMVVGGMEVHEDLSCSEVIPDWEPAFRAAFEPAVLSHFRRALLVGAGHANALYLERIVRRYLHRVCGGRLECQTKMIRATTFDASLCAMRSFEAMRSDLGEEDLIISFSDFLSIGIREAFRDCENPPTLVSVDNMEAYQKEVGEGVLSSIDWRFTDSYVEGARQLLRMIREDDSCNYIIKLPCRFVSRPSGLDVGAGVSP